MTKRMRAANEHIRQFLKLDAFVLFWSLICCLSFSTSLAFSVISYFFSALAPFGRDSEDYFVTEVGAAPLLVEAFVELDTVPLVADGAFEDG